MKHLENFNRWYDKILNGFPFCLDDSKIKTTGLAWLFRENNHWNLIPRITNDDAQYYNAGFFVRSNLSSIGIIILTYLLAQFLHWYFWSSILVGLIFASSLVGSPFALFFMIRWSATGRRQFIQTGIGWKQTGRFAIHRRVQSDASSAEGYHAGLPNTDHAVAWNYGKH